MDIPLPEISANALITQLRAIERVIDAAVRDDLVRMHGVVKGVDIFERCQAGRGNEPERRMYMRATLRVMPGQLRQINIDPPEL